MRAVIFVLGLCLTVAGVSLWSLPAGLVLAGMELAGLAWLLEKAAAARAPKQKPRDREEYL